MHDLESAAAARASLRVGGVGHALQLLQHEHGDHELAVDEAGRDEVADAPVDDRGGVHEHPEQRRALAFPLAFPAAARAARLGAALGAALVGAEAAQAQDRALAARAHDREQVAEHERQRQQQVAPDVRQRPHGERRQRRGAEAEHESDSADDEFAGGTRLCCSFDPPDRSHQRPGDDPADEQSGECSHRDRERPAGPGRRRQKIVGKGPWTGRDLAACECSQEGEDQPHDQLHGQRSFIRGAVGPVQKPASASARSLARSSGRS